ncbi:hypothetical protein DdX_21533 [Ditylenchus destructor]|uniref:F-box domain-containing protein n=1 Tax=Ditylenchus destructor TaxID=166010 RepID=A0AAD4MFE2_9BILA|nr:hypothetical protein DdX_21533 [Ditylenchus destructor]
MIPSWCLLNVLNYFGRYELDLLQETNKRVKSIINQQFASKPYLFRAGLRLLLESRHGEILLKLYSSVDCFVPNLREWRKDEYDEGIGDFSCDHFYSVEQMRPFLTEFLRISSTEIVITTCPYAPDLDIIAPLESVSHVWAGQRLDINGYSNGTGASFDQIFRSSMILQCRDLRFHCKTFGLQFYKYPGLFNLHLFHYCKLLTNEVLLDIIQQKAHYPKSDTTFVLYVSTFDDILSGIETLRNVSSLLLLFHPGWSA